MHEQQRVENDGQQEVRHRSGQHDCDSLSHGFSVEGTMPFVRGDFPFAFVKHLDVAPERKRRQGPLGLIDAEPVAPQDLTETYRETKHFDIAHAGNDIVAQLVKHDQYPESDDECEQG